VRQLLGFGGFAIGLLGLFSMFGAKTSINEGVSAIIMLIGAVAFVGGAILTAIESVRTTVASSLSSVHSELTDIRKALAKQSQAGAS
jgi:hypothetical protein